MPVETHPEEVGLDSQKLHQVFEAYRRRYEQGILPGGVMSVGREGKVCFEECFGHGGYPAR